MRTLARDKRGFPIPFLVMVDKTGMPQFTINDVERAEQCRRKRLCSVCGRRFDADGVWLIGGSRCFLSDRGAFIDPPMHHDCAAYSLRVCPFLAASRYLHRIDDAKLAPGAMSDGRTLLRTDFMPPELPERFGLGCTHDYRWQDLHPPGNGVYVVARWDYIEWWHNGERVNAPDSSEPVA
jgi:hypothetical protein